MATLLVPPPSPTAASPRSSVPPTQSPPIKLPSVAGGGRTLAEYAQFFALDVPALKNRDVLDVAAGPSSFVAEACARGIDAVAVDPRYGSTPDSLATHVQLDDASRRTQLRARPELFRRRAFASCETAEADRRSAAQRFLTDYETHFVHGRYVGGALPRLPFFDNAFDLVLCAHLLFISAKRFELEWQVAACRELVRVSAGEVRVHPVCGADGKPYPKLAALRRELRADGIGSEVVRVDYEFFIGSSAMLVLKKGTS